MPSESVVAVDLVANGARRVGVGRSTCVAGVASVGSAGGYCGGGGAGWGPAVRGRVAR